MTVVWDTKALLKPSESRALGNRHFQRGPRDTRTGKRGFLTPAPLSFGHNLTSNTLILLSFLHISEVRNLTWFWRLPPPGRGSLLPVMHYTVTAKPLHISWLTAWGCTEYTPTPGSSGHST
jgi:hypothetical protein